jgi:hypothetical protein
MHRLLSRGLALALALPLLTVARPGLAAETPTIVASAQGHAEPFVFAWVDGNDGSVKIDSKLAEQVKNTFAQIRWVFLSNNRLVLGHLKGDTLETVFSPVQVSNSAGTYFLYHQRSSDGKTILNGSAVRYSDDPSRGYAEFTLVLLQDGGTADTVHVEQTLAFAGSSGG